MSMRLHMQNMHMMTIGGASNIVLHVSMTAKILDWLEENPSGRKINSNTMKHRNFVLAGFRNCNSGVDNPHSTGMT